MLYKTTLGLPEQYIASEDIAKGDVLSLSNVHLKETFVEGGEEEDQTQYEIDIWYMRKYKEDEETMPLAVSCQDVSEDEEIKKIILFQMPTFVSIRKP
jgi:hypothetical protein